MKNYLFGISILCENILSSGFLDGYGIDGLFDNSPEKWGIVQYGHEIKKPYYNPEINIVVTAGRRYWVEIITQLMNLGYRRITLIYKTENGYAERILDYSHLDYEQDKEKLVLLYLEHKSYSGIWAVYQLWKNHLVNTYGFKLKFFDAEPESDEHIYYQVAARYIITEKAWKYNRNEFNAELVQLWHGYPLKALGHMLADSNETICRYEDEYWSKYDYIASYGQMYTAFLCASYATMADRFIVTGMPRNDFLYITDGRKNITERFPACEGKKIVLYMPTFRQGERNVKNGDSQGYMFYWNDFDVEQLQDFCRKNNIFFIFKLHPSDSSKVNEWCLESDCLGSLTDALLGDKAMYEFLNGADVLITDYSSVYFDYLLLDRPVIFTNKDESAYLNNRGFMLEPLDFWRPGAKVNKMPDFYETIKKAVEGVDEYKEARKTLIPLVHKHVDGNSTQRLFDFMKRNKV